MASKTALAVFVELVVVRNFVALGNRRLRIDDNLFLAIVGDNLSTAICLHPPGTRKYNQ